MVKIGSLIQDYDLHIDLLGINIPTPNVIALHVQIRTVALTLMKH